ncbi:MAG TPA: SPOR domain-containing protein [Myxococcota bacterium]|nr:SPOR domain-containing protein [Myxococcota bacterium]
MSDREGQPRQKAKSRGRSAGAMRIVYGSLLVAIGACVGIVIGSVSDTPRLLLERLRGPVATVDLAAPVATTAAPAPAAEPAAKASPPLEAFGELQKGTPPAATAPPVSSPPPPAAPKPAAPPPAAKVSSPAPAPVKAPAAAAPKSADEVMRGLQQSAPASPTAASAGAHSVVQVLSLAERAQADALVARLKSQGFQPYLMAMPDKSGRYRVRVKPDAGQSVPELEQKLRGLGMKTWITAE